MTIPEHKIAVNDESNKYYPFGEKSKKIEKPFIFKGYKNEDERIKDSIKKMVIHLIIQFQWII